MKLRLCLTLSIFWLLLYRRRHCRRWTENISNSILDTLCKCEINFRGMICSILWWLWWLRWLRWLWWVWVCIVSVPCWPLLWSLVYECFWLWRCVASLCCDALWAVLSCFCDGLLIGCEGVIVLAHLWDIIWVIIIILLL